jgi:hypothetical protein
MAEVTDPLSGETARLHDDIDRMRLSLDQKLDALEERLAPRELAQDAWDAVRQRSSVGAERAWRAARAYPLPAATILAGIGWLLYSRRSHGGRRRKASLGNLGSRIGDGAARTAAELGRRAEHAASAIRQNATRLVDRAAGRRRPASRFGELFDDHPLAFGSVCLLAGVVAGILIPASRREQRWMRAQRDRLVSSAREAGRQVVEKGRQAAEAAMDAAHSAVSETSR